MSNQVAVGGGLLYGLFSCSLVMNDSVAGASIKVSGYITPQATGARLVHAASVTRIKNSGGFTSTIVGGDEQLECAFDFIPHGSSFSFARESAELPGIPCAVKISGLPILRIGPWSDALNYDGAGQATGLTNTPWIYEGGATLSGTSDSHWTGSFTLHRYQGITTSTVTFQTNP